MLEEWVTISMWLRMLIDFDRCYITDSNIMEALGYYKADIPETTLGDIQALLADSIATVFWRGKKNSAFF